MAKDLAFRPPLSHQLHSGYFHPVLREWHNKSDNLLYPIFITSDPDGQETIPGLVGVYRWGLNKIIGHLEPLVKDYNLKSVLLFAVDKVSVRDEVGSCAEKLICEALQKLRTHFGESLLLCADVCLCTFTSHGHCGIYKTDSEQAESQNIPHTLRTRDMDKTRKRLADISLAYAKAGAHVIAPSDLQDARIGAIKQVLIDNGLETQVSILSYSAKFASCFYGPFRNACGSAPKTGSGDQKEQTNLSYPKGRETYQLPKGSTGLAIRASQRDVDEGADFLMVKPGMAYLDVISALKTNFPYHPVAVYQVSGEFAMIKAVSSMPNSGFTVEDLLEEMLCSFQRAGASIVITYFTPDILKLKKEGKL